MASTVDAIQSLIGKPKSHWIGQHTWIPESNLYSPEELRRIFGNECTLFVGDSLQRRAADTLHLLLQQEGNDVKDSVFSDEYFKNSKKDRGFVQRNIGNNNTQRMGCLDTDWRPLLADVQQFAKDFVNQTEIYKDYTVIVVGSTIWDVVGSSRRRTSAHEVRQLIRETIHALQDNIPPHVQVIWKSSGWCHDCGWTPDEHRKGHGDNYKVYAANEAAQQATSNSSIHYLDWAREVLPRSLGDDRILSGDNNLYHYGLEPRLQMLQMLAEVYEKGWQQQQDNSSANSQPQHVTNDDVFNEQIFNAMQRPQQLSTLLLLLIGVTTISLRLRQRGSIKRTKKSLRPLKSRFDSS